MKKIITIICDTDVPTKHLLNNVDYDVYQAVGQEDIFTLCTKKVYLGAIPGTETVVEVKKDIRANIESSV